jgi:hypothetical protein
MTIVVTAKVTDGIVLAADSAATFFIPPAIHMEQCELYIPMLGQSQ